MCVLRPIGGGGGASAGGCDCGVQSSVSIWSHHTINLLVDQELLSLWHSLQCARLPVLRGTGCWRRANVKIDDVSLTGWGNPNFHADCCIKKYTDLLYYGAKCLFLFPKPLNLHSNANFIKSIINENPLRCLFTLYLRKHIQFYLISHSNYVFYISNRNVCKFMRARFCVKARHRVSVPMRHSFSSCLPK